MKIKLFAVTYNNNRILNDFFLKSLFNSDLTAGHLEVYIIDNHSNIYIRREYKSKVITIANNLRPDFSTGHLARSWNQCIINGFENLVNPKCDVVVACQADTILDFKWLSDTIDCIKTNVKYCTAGAGDQFQIFTPEAIKNIGLYDERFCNIGFQEADYFLRALKFFPNNISINDYHHNRVFNPLKYKFVNSELDGRILLCGHDRQDNGTMISLEHHDLSNTIFQYKWGQKVDTTNWQASFTNDLSLKGDNFIYYPYFEKDIPFEKLKQQNFII